MYKKVVATGNRWVPKRLGRIAGCLLTAGAIGIAQVAAAQSTDDASSLGEVVVTARKQSERLRDVPITMTVQTGQDLTNAGVTDTRDLATVVPGLVISGQGAFFQPSLRGVSGTLVQPGANNPVAVYIDGIYQPNLIGDLFDLPDVERLEVLKGPQGTLFGRNASAGAISAYTKDPTFTPSGFVSVGDGVYFGGSAHTSNDFTTKLNISGPLIDDILAGSLTGYYDQVPGYLNNDVIGGQTGDIRSYVYRAKLLFKPTDDLKFVLTAFRSSKHDDANSSTTAYEGVTVARFYPGAVVPTLPWHVASELNHATSSVATQQTGTSLRAEWDVQNAGTLTSLTGFTRVYSLYLADVDGAYAPACVAVFACITPYLVNYGPESTFQQELSFSSRKFGPTSFVAGLFYYHDLADYSTAVNPPLNPDGGGTGAPAGYNTNAPVKTKAYAAYGEATTDITSALHVITGVRYSWEEQSSRGSINGGPEFDIGDRPHWSAVTPRLSVRYDVSDSANVYATYSEGFKSGVLDAVSLTQDVAQPEKLRSYELGTKFGSTNLSFDLSAFYYNYSNLQVEFQNPNASTVIGNAERATLYGLDFDTTARLGGGFQLHAGGSYLPHAIYRTLHGAIDYAQPLTATGLQQVVLDASGNRILRAPVFTGNLSLSYERDTGLGKWDSSTILYGSSAYAYDFLHNVQSNQYTTIGAQVGFRPTGSKLHFSLWGKNLANRYHVEATTLSGAANTVVYSPPREVGITADYSF